MDASLKITQTSQSNFVPAFFFLPKEKRLALSIVYAYCRLTDDIVDKVPEGSDLLEAHQELILWRKETERSFREPVEHPVLRELSQVVSKYAISQKDILHLIDGVQIDLEKKEYASFEELYPYCYGVASTVGLMCLPIFGTKKPETKNYAINLGIAFQLTNILRDIRTDAERGRIYIPLEDLKKFGFTEESWLKLVTDTNFSEKLVSVTNFRELMFFEGKRAEEFYLKAKENLLKEERPFLLAPLMMTSVYHSVLKKILQNPEAVLRTKVGLSKLKIFFRLIAVWLKER